MARNPYQPGVGTVPPYLAGREPALRQFRRILAGYPEKRRNLRVTGLRGVGKTVLLKEFAKVADRDPDREWIVIRHDLVPRMASEAVFVEALSNYLTNALDQLSATRRVQRQVTAALKAIADVRVEIPGISVSVGKHAVDASPGLLEDRLIKALVAVGSVAFELGKGVIFMFDEAHEVYDQPSRSEYPLSALLAAIVAAQDQEQPPLPVMFVLCGLPPLVGISRTRGATPSVCSARSRSGTSRWCPRAPTC